MFSRQLFKIVRKINYIKRFVADFQGNIGESTKVLIPLPDRKLIKIYGKDAPEFLQGLITNDMRHFNQGIRSIYAMFLNNKGRVLFDTLIHKWEGNETFIIECDKGVYSQLQNHINRHKLKRQVKIEDINNEYRMWTLISPSLFVPIFELDVKNPFNLFIDPRLSYLGCRVLADQTLEVNKLLTCLGENVLQGEPEVYRYLRYKLGVGEGPGDLPPGECFPLEANCDYLHGVSFHKGCYVGQELTARIHHTGVIRKRLMPIKFPDAVADILETDVTIKDADIPKSNLGKFKGYVHDYGLGLVRTKEALAAKRLKIGEYFAEAIKPDWWPTIQETSKDSFTSDKNA